MTIRNQFKLKVKDYFTNYNWKIKAKIITVVVLMFLIVFDQVIKWVVKENLQLDQELIMIPGFINLQYVINHGSAFGLNQGKTILLMTFAFIIAVILLTWWVFSRHTSHMVAIIFVLGGTIGNLIDRFLNDGGVIDFLKWDMFQPKTIFNLADVMVTIGIIIIVITLIVGWIKTFNYNRQEQKKLQAKKVGSKINDKTAKEAASAATSETARKPI
ncbi:MAG: signal peptidase II [Spiroplasma sp.]|nr:signal peptidase II [Spiroplasma sp.]